jgi:hypothetical protein
MDSILDKDVVFSIKTNIGKYDKVATISQGKFGPRFSITPEGHRVICDFLKAPPTFLNLNIKVFEPREGNRPRIDNPVVQTPAEYKTVELDDNIPF